MKNTFTKAVIALALGLGIAVGGAQTAQHVDAASGVVTVHYVKGYGIALWNSPDAGRKPIAGRKLADGSAWKYGQTKVVDGVTWYQLGTNQWAQGTYLAVRGTTTAPAVTQKSGVMTINYVYGYGVAVRKAPNGAVVSPAKYLQHGSHWKYFGTATVNYKTWYNVGGNQWVDGSYVALGSVAVAGANGSVQVSDHKTEAGTLAPNGDKVYAYNPAKDMSLSAKARADAQKEQDLKNAMYAARDAGDYATADKLYEQLDKYNTVGHF
ncbi:SLAP domain-containing protein [Lacticaseibacillus saniviri]